MFERPSTGERAVLVHQHAGRGTPAPEDLHEFRELARAAGASVVALVLASRPRPDSRLYIGSGKAEEVKAIIQGEGADLVIFDHSLSPSQERNLEREFECRVLDRTGLILDIFAQRARSFEGKLQVELAQLRHMSTRLVRGWTHLERQKGGIGLRGPGETQLETDRRLLDGRIDQIRRRLDKVDSQRNQGRRARTRAEIPTVSLVGYTNAGKSTLFNRLTEAGVYVQDLLFATLDPTLRRLDLPGEGSVILADTVGFISNLPHELVAAFKSTLQETVEADLLLHVVDDSSPQRDRCMEEVNQVLAQIGAAELPQVILYNKIDRIEGAEPRIERGEDGLIHRVWLSALEGDGVELLLQGLAEFFHHEHIKRVVRLNAHEGRLHAELHRVGKVSRDLPLDDGGWEIEVELPMREFRRIIKGDEALARRFGA